MVSANPYNPGVRSAFNLVVAVTVAVSLGACGGSSTIDAGADNTEPLSFAAASSAGQSESITIDLSGSQVLPPSDTRATGRASFILDTETLQIYGVLNTSVVGPASVNLHEGGVGEVGAVVVSLVQQTDGSFSVPQSTILIPEQGALFESGKLYVDVVSDNEEIRGQLSADVVLPELTAALSDIQALVFTPMCSGCHTGSGISLPSVMNFTTEQASYNSLVGVTSLSDDRLLRVEPGSPQTSLLIHKLEGTQEVGSRMPFRGARLNEQTINSIRQWIALGANR